jgi:hypothetical protein
VLKNNCTDEANKAMGNSKISKKAQLQFSGFIVILPMYPSYVETNKNSPVTGRVSAYPCGEEKKDIRLKIGGY